MTKLSIVIPTHNRSSQIQNLIACLRNLIQDYQWPDIQILISDNFSSMPVEQIIENKSNIQIVKPPKFLLTAEENLAFALTFAIGEYIWVLGDDDIPISSGWGKIWEIISSQKLEFCIMNSLNVNTNIHTNRLRILEDINHLPVSEFFKFFGFWSVPAGFSTLLFKRNKFNLKFMHELIENDEIIYSHVTTLFYSAFESGISIISTPTVIYNDNSFDNATSTDFDQMYHWFKYSDATKKYFRYPWVTSFIKQLNRLFDLQILSPADIKIALDQSHRGNKFFIFENIITIYISQLILELEKKPSIRVSEAEKREFIKFVEAVHQPYLEILSRSEIYYEAQKIEELRHLIATLSNFDTQLTARILNTYLGYPIYEIPHGLFWTPYKIELQRDWGHQSRPLNGFYGSNLKDLTAKIDESLDLQPFLFNPEISKLNVNSINSLLAKLHKIKRIFNINH